jgi:hypothetical protein
MLQFTGFIVNRRQKAASVSAQPAKKESQPAKKD